MFLYATCVEMDIDMELQFAGSLPMTGSWNADRKRMVGGSPQ